MIQPCRPRCLTLSSFLSLDVLIDIEINVLCTNYLAMAITIYVEEINKLEVLGDSVLIHIAKLFFRPALLTRDSVQTGGDGPSRPPRCRQTRTERVSGGSYGQHSVSLPPYFDLHIYRPKRFYFTIYFPF